MSIRPTSSIPERFEKHESRNWVSPGFNHKTSLTMGALVPLGVKEVLPGELCKVYAELMMRFAPLFLPIMHQVYYTLDWFYVRTGSLFQNTYTSSFESFMMQHPVTGTIQWAYFNYKRADAVYTDGILNYMGFNAPPTTGTLISQISVSAIPPAAYYKIWSWHYRNSNIQADPYVNSFILSPGDNTSIIESILPDLRVLRRNWPRDYYTVATPEPQFGANVLIPSFATDPETGDYVPQKVFGLDGTGAPNTDLIVNLSNQFAAQDNTPLVLQMSSTIRDLRYSESMTEFLERATRAGVTSDPLSVGNWNDFVKRYFGWNPNPLMIDAPVWIGGVTGSVVITDVMSTAEVGTQKVGSYAGKAMVRDNVQSFTYQVPDYGLIIPILTVYPKASYYTGMSKIWTRQNKMDYLWEQFAYIGDQPMKNKEVWFSWYDADIEWNDEIFGYSQQYNDWRYSNDIVSGQLRTLWESFHLGRKFTGAGQVVLNDDFIQCVPDIGRVFDVDAEAGEHEIYLHSWIGIDILRRLPKYAIPES